MNSVMYGERAFFFCAPTLWNTLPDSLKNAASLSSFKSALRTLLFWKFYFYQRETLYRFLFYLNLFYISTGIIIFQFYNQLLVSSLYFILL